MRVKELIALLESLPENVKEYTVRSIHPLKDGGYDELQEKDVEVHDRWENGTVVI